MNSVWLDGEERPSFAPLAESKRTDVLVIGGGMAGILCAYMLRAAGVDCILVEADRICGGVTENTTAKITLQHGLIYDKLMRNFGKENARLYFEAQVGAGKQFERLCGQISCDYEKKDSYVYSVDDRAKLEREQIALESIGCRSQLCSELPLPFDVAGAVKVKDQAQFHL